MTGDATNDEAGPINSGDDIAWHSKRALNLFNRERRKWRWQRKTHTVLTDAKGMDLHPFDAMKILRDAHGLTWSEARQALFEHELWQEEADSIRYHTDLFWEVIETMAEDRPDEVTVERRRDAKTGIEERVIILHPKEEHR